MESTGSESFSIVPDVYIIVAEIVEPDAIELANSTGTYIFRAVITRTLDLLTLILGYLVSSLVNAAAF